MNPYSNDRYIGTDISNRALETVDELKRTLPQRLDLYIGIKVPDYFDCNVGTNLAIAFCFWIVVM